jgi:hypothetical protein
MILKLKAKPRVLGRMTWQKFLNYLEWYGVIIGAPVIFLLLIVAYVYIKDRSKRL